MLEDASSFVVVRDAPDELWGGLNSSPLALSDWILRRSCTIGIHAHHDFLKSVSHLDRVRDRKALLGLWITDPAEGSGRAAFGTELAH